MSSVDFGTWLVELRGALEGDHGMDVPCGDCTACCTASQFVAVGPDEVDALAHIPAELLVPAPGRPDGHMVLGYDERGHCPMLVDGGCSIYAHRPVACRTYDCRIFAAAGVEPDDPAVADRVRRWRFTFADDDARAEHVALLRAVDEVREQDIGPVNATGVAVRAVEITRRAGR